MVPGHPLQFVPGHPLHLGLGRVLSREAESDAMGEDGSERATSEVCGAGGERRGAHDGVVPRVLYFAADRISLAAKI